MELLDYEQETGRLFWKKRDPKWFEAKPRRPAEHQANWWNSRFAGQEALTAINSDGYRTGSILARPIKAHRVIWKMVHGTEPDLLDHIDGNPSNNRIANLRDVTAMQNAQNARMIAGSQTGVLGVTLTRYGRFVARIRFNGRPMHLGTFGSLEDAATARKAASIKFGFHPNHGRST